MAQNYILSLPLFLYLLFALAYPVQKGEKSWQNLKRLQ